MHIIETLTQYLEQFSLLVPVEIFTFTGAFVEEVISPIPSPIVMTLAGSIADSQGKPFMFLLWLSLVGAVGKIIGSGILYVVSDKAEDFLMSKFGGLLGVSHQDVENFGQHFGKGNRDFVLILLARIVPIMPTAPISVAAGILKLPFKSYMVSSFLGYLGRNMIYLYIGYIGHASYQNILEGLDSMESVVQLLMGLAAVAVVGWMYYKRGKVDAMGVIDNKINKGEE